MYNIISCQNTYKTCTRYELHQNDWKTIKTKYSLTNSWMKTQEWQEQSCLNPFNHQLCLKTFTQSCYNLRNSCTSHSQNNLTSALDTLYSSQLNLVISKTTLELCRGHQGLHLSSYTWSLNQRDRWCYVVTCVQQREESKTDFWWLIFLMKFCRKRI